MSSAPRDTLAVLTDIVARKARVDRARIRPNSRFVDFGIDSVRATEIVVELERVFSITIPDQDLMELETIAEIARYLDRRQAS